MKQSGFSDEIRQENNLYSFISWRIKQYSSFIFYNPKSNDYELFKELDASITPRVT